MFGGLYFSQTYFCGIPVGVVTPVIPPVPPLIGPTKGGYGGPISLRDREIEYQLWIDRQEQLWFQYNERLLQEQNADDLEVVQILTEFLSRQ